MKRPWKPASVYMIVLLLASCTPFEFYATLDQPIRGAGAPAGAVPTVVPVTLSPRRVHVLPNSLTTFSASSGTPPYTFVLSGAGHIDATGATCVYTAPSAPAAPATVTVKDSVGQQSVATVVMNLQITPSIAYLPSSGTISFAANGGVPPYVFTEVAGAPAGVVNAVTGAYTAPGTAGNDSVKVTDSEGTTSTASITIFTPGAGLAITPNAVTVSAGATVALVATGGTPPYTLTLQSGGGTFDPVTLLYTAPGNTTVAVVQVTDSATPSPASQQATITVNPPPLAISPTTIAVEVNGSVTFAGFGGSPPYTYSVVSPGTGTINASTGVFTAPGAAETDTVRVTDSVSAHLDATVTVYDPLTISPNYIWVSTSAGYGFAAAGGVPPYSYDITSGAGSGSIGAATGVYAAPTSPMSAAVRVQDSIGNQSVSAVTVFTPPSGWSVEQVDTVLSSGAYSSLAIDSNHNPWVAYYDQTNSKLRVVTKSGSWTALPDPDNSLNAGLYCSLALDGNNYPNISYYDAGTHVLKFVRWNGAGWDPVRIVDSSTDVGQYSSLALDPTTFQPRISYYDAGNGDLKFASSADSGASWTLTTVDSTGNVGEYSSLVLDPTTFDPRISYYDMTNRQLKYAFYATSTWTLRVVDNSSDVGQFSSLALNSKGFPRISYYDYTNKRLKYAVATNSSGSPSSWTIYVVDSSADVGQYSSLALNTSVSPAIAFIAYYDATNQDLKYATSTDVGLTWTVATLDTGGTADVGRYASLKLDPGSYRVRISFMDYSAQDLKLMQAQ